MPCALNLLGGLESPQNDESPRIASDEQGPEAPEYPCLLPMLSRRKVRMNLPDCFDHREPTKETDPSGLGSCRSGGSRRNRENRGRCMALATPSSCGGASVSHKFILTPTTPDPNREDFKLPSCSSGVSVIIFDFDGTLTATRGELALRSQKCGELQERAPMLRPWLAALRIAGITIGVMSKSSENTIRDAFDQSGLTEMFADGPLLGKAIGLEGKAGFIQDFVNGCCDSSNSLAQLGEEGLDSILLIDDDVRELDRARDKGIQTYPAPQEGGLQSEDFRKIFECLEIDGPINNSA